MKIPKFLTPREGESVEAWERRMRKQYANFCDAMIFWTAVICLAILAIGALCGRFD